MKGFATLQTVDIPNCFAFMILSLQEDEKLSSVVTRCVTMPLILSRNPAPYLATLLSKLLRTTLSDPQQQNTISSNRVSRLFFLETLDLALLDMGVRAT